MDNNELTLAERKAIAALPRERIPNRGLEERTVRSLRRRGLLRAPGRSGITLSPTWAGAAAAAVIAVVVGSFALGQYAGSHQTEQAMLAVRERDNLQLATEVQRAGTAYITALAALSQSPRNRDPGAHEQGREAAVSALYAAAEFVASLTPDDPLAMNILRVSEETGRDATERRIVWF